MKNDDIYNMTDVDAICVFMILLLIMIVVVSLTILSNIANTPEPERYFRPVNKCSTDVILY